MRNMTILHTLPERVHLKVPAVKNVQMAQVFESKGKAIDGIHWVRANSKCAGLVVRFDGSMHSTDDIVEMMRQIASGGNA